MNNNYLLLFSAPLVGFFTSLIIYFYLKRQPAGDEKMKEISSAIQTGAKAFLNEVYKILFVFVLV
ncbi:MAG: sodium/proton-translocating pyrophosphatase, partial [Minisyncoccia bacterium]